ncbi:MAG TPA: beta-L-arabinofuranosidase domain-containing protein, partial [Thermomicrobiales bacterium]|nr:beta-L-arabinofuranosidase domain-containing protein [Thermomicrobiales bacterium]
MSETIEQRQATMANGAVGSSRPAASPGLHQFEYAGVTLLPSRFLEQMGLAREVYFGVPNDDILKGFRREAGLPAPGNDMRGWCSKTSAVIFGQLLSGMSRLSRATGDDDLRDKAITLFEGWRETLGPDGDARMWPYAWEKLVCGLVDLERYAGYDDALPTLEATTAWASRTFDRTRRLADEYDFWGAAPGDTSEWYTLPENLYRAYLLTGNPLFKEFADVWRYEDYWGQFAETSELTDVVPVHAYSHVNTFSSAAMVYAVHGDPRYLDICVNAYDFLQRTQCYA